MPQITSSPAQRENRISALRLFLIMAYFKSKFIMYSSFSGVVSSSSNISSALIRSALNLSKIYSKNIISAAAKNIKPKNRQILFLLPKTKNIKVINKLTTLAVSLKLNFFILQRVDNKEYDDYNNKNNISNHPTNAFA